MTDKTKEEKKENAQTICKHCGYGVTHLVNKVGDWQCQRCGFIGQSSQDSPSKIMCDCNCGRIADVSLCKKCLNKLRHENK